MSDGFTRLTKDATKAETLAAYEAEYATGRWPCRAAPSDEPRCLYRGPKQNACAIGMFLPDKVAQALDSPFTGGSVLACWDTVAPYLPEWMDFDEALLIQKAHDGLRMDQLRQILSH